MLRIPVLLTVLALCVDSGFAAEPTLTRFSRTERHMGADFSAILYAADEKEAEKGFQAVFQIASEVDRSMSDYNSESELSRLSQSSPTKSPVVVSGRLFEVLELSHAFSEKTDGA